MKRQPALVLKSHIPSSIVYIQTVVLRSKVVGVCLSKTNGRDVEPAAPQSRNAFILLRKGHCTGCALWLTSFLDTALFDNGHVWMEVLVLVCSKLTLKLTLWSQTHVLVWC
jgi:hypothetical protein